MTSKTHGPHRRNNKSQYQECTCKMDKSLNRGMLNEFESSKICWLSVWQKWFWFLHCRTQRVACDKNLFRWRERRLSTIETKRDGGFFWNYCDNCHNPFYYFNFVRAGWRLMNFFLYCVLCFFICMLWRGTCTMLCVEILHHQQVLC